MRLCCERLASTDLRRERIQARSKNGSFWDPYGILRINILKIIHLSLEFKEPFLPCDLSVVHAKLWYFNWL